MIEELQMIQCMVSCIELMIKAAILPDVDLRSPVLRWNLIRTELVSNGVPFDSRRERHLMNQVRSCVLFEAVMRLFFTTDIFPADHEFEFSDLLQAAPFLFGTEEHLLFVLTHAESTVTDASVDEVLKALLEMSIRSDNTTSFATQVEPAARRTAPTATTTTTRFATSVDENAKRVTSDYNTLFISTVGEDQNSAAVLNKVATKVVSHIHRTQKKKLLIPNVLSILHRLQDTVTEVHQYHGEADQDFTDEHKVATQVVRVCLHSANVLGLEVNRAYVHMAMNRTASVLQEAIEATCSRHTKKRIVLTGRAMRSKDCMYPHLFKTMVSNPNLARDTKIMNVDFRAPGYAQAVLGLGLDDTTYVQQKVYKVIDEDIDTHCYKDFLRYNHLRGPTVAFPVCTSWRVASYPSMCQQRYKESFGDENAAPTTTTTRTTIKQQGPDDDDDGRFTGGEGNNKRVRVG
jgi:N-acetylglucosamine kinase-like BadF-type ATPase